LPFRPFSDGAIKDVIVFWCFFIRYIPNRKGALVAIVIAAFRDGKFRTGQYEIGTGKREREKGGGRAKGEAQDWANNS
jgi:hypothetical protein